MGLPAIERIHSLVIESGRQLSFIEADKSLQASPPLKETGQVSSATFYLLYIASLLPDDVHTVINLDLDFVAVRSALELFSTDLESPIAAVGHSRPEEAKRVFGDRLGTYFQAGGSSLTSRSRDSQMLRNASGRFWGVSATGLGGGTRTYSTLLSPVTGRDCPFGSTLAAT